jgi:uncharacterized protein
VNPGLLLEASGALDVTPTASVLVLALVSLVVAFFASFAQAVTGFGFALVAIPLLAAVTGVQTAVVGVTVLSAVLTVGASVRHRREADWAVAGKLSVAALVGMPLGLLALMWLEQRVLTVGVAMLVLLFAAATLRELRLRKGIIATGGAGLVAGVLLTSTGMNGPPLVAALQAMNFPPHRLRATLQATFSVQDILAVVGFALVGQLTADSWLVVVAGLPGVLIGWLVGDLVFARVPVARFKAVVFCTLLGSAILLLVQALQS